MSENKSTLRRIIDRNVERHLVKEFLMNNTKKAGFGGLDIRRTPAGTEVTIKAERPGMVIGRKGKIINDLQNRIIHIFTRQCLSADIINDLALLIHHIIVFQQMLANAKVAYFHFFLGIAYGFGNHSS